MRPAVAVRAVVGALVACALTAATLVAPPAQAVTRPALGAVVNGVYVPNTNGLVQCPSTGWFATVGELPVPQLSGACQALDLLEDRATARVRTLRGLSGTDEQIRAAAWPDVEAAMWLDLLTTLDKPAAERDQYEGYLVDWLSSSWKNYQVAMMDAALYEYSQWRGTEPDGRPGACTYTPPAPYQSEYPTNGVRWSGCRATRGGLGTLLDAGPEKPSFAQFVKWGSVRVTDEVSSASAMSIRGQAALIGLASGAAAGLTAGGSVAAWVKSVPYSRATTVFKFLGSVDELLLENGEKIVKQVVKGVKLLKFAGFIFSVVSFVIDAIVTQALRVFAPDPGDQLRSAARDVDATTYDAAAVNRNPETGQVLQSLFFKSLSTADPTSPFTDPERLPSDASFVVNPGTPGATPANRFSVKAFDGTAQTVEMRSGFFVVTSASGTKSVQTSFDALDGDGKLVTVSQLRDGDAYTWQIVPAAGQAICGAAGSVTCPVSRSVRLTLGDGAVGMVALVTTDGPALTLDGPLTVGEGVPATYTATAGSTPLTDVTWSARRQFRAWGREGTDFATDPCASLPGYLFFTFTADGFVPTSPWADDVECFVSGSGPVTPTFAENGLWNLSVSGRDADGVRRSVATTVTVTNRAPRVALDVTYCSAPGVPAGCVPFQFPEGTDVVVSGTLTDGPAQALTLTLLRGDQVVTSARVPCVASAAAYQPAWGTTVPQCAPGFTATTVPTATGGPSGATKFSLKLRYDEPFTGPMRIVLTDDQPGDDGTTLDLGADAGWTNVAPRDPAFPPPLPSVVRARERVTLSGFVTDPGGTSSLTLGLGTVNGQFVSRPTLSRVDTSTWAWSWSGVMPEHPTNQQYTATAVFGFVDAQGLLGTVQRTVVVLPVVDPTPPVVTLDPVITQNGWLRAFPGELTWTVKDPESKVTIPVPCRTKLVGESGEPVTYTCTASSWGGTTTQSVSFKRDITAPSITVVGGPEDGATYAPDEVPPAPTCEAYDDLSGIDAAGCAVTGWSNAVGVHAVSVTATDVAGNFAGVSRTYVVEERDAAGPVIEAIVSGRSGLNGWYTGGVVSIEWRITEPNGLQWYENGGCGQDTQGPNTAGSTFRCSAFSDGGSRTKLVTIKKDSDPPTITVTGGPQDGETYGASQVPPAGTCTGVGTPAPVVGGCVVTGWSDAVGPHLVEYRLSDEAGNTASRIAFYEVTDDSAPTVEPSVEGTPTDGWYTSDATLTWAVDDEQSPVTAVDGCDPLLLDTDTPAAGRTVTCRAESSGGATTRSVTLRRDATGPTLTAVGVPDDGATYTAATLPASPSCTASDAGAGVDAAGCRVFGFTTEVGTHTLTLLADDVLGNRTLQTRTYTVTGPDETAPDVTGSLGGLTPGTVWATGDVDVSWTVVDTQSDVTATEGCGPTTVDTDTAATLFICTATSAGGTTSRQLVVQRDATPPELDVFGGPEDGVTYLPKDLPPAPVCTVSDATSGTTDAGCVVSGYSPAAGRHTVTLRASDVAGNTTTRTLTYTVLADTTPPTLDLSVTGTQGEAGWYVDDVVVDFRPTDGESDVSLQDQCGPATVDTDTAGATFDCLAVSVGGQAEDRVTVKRDATAPTLEVTGGPADGGRYAPGEVPAAPVCVASDATSGVAGAGCTVTGWSSALGVHTLRFTAKDVAGNAVVASRSYTVAASGPGAPTDVRATAGDRSATVTWTAPAAGGVTGYRVSATAPGRPTVTATTTATRVRLAPLVAGATYTVSVVATSPAGDSAPGTTTVVPVRPPGLTGSAPAGTAGVAYAFTYSRTGVPVPTVTLAAGSLPPGLTLTTGGRLSGTPTRSGTFGFTLQASSTAGSARLAQVVTVVAGAPASVSVVGGSGQTVGLGQPFGTDLAARVADAFGNPVAGRSVVFSARTGLATFAGGAATATVTTGADGVATAPRATAGPTALTGQVLVGVDGTSLPRAGLVLGVAATAAGRSDLVVGVTGPATLARGATGTYTVTVSNTGPASAAQVLPLLSLGAGLSVVGADGIAWWTARTAGLAPVTLAAGASRSFTVTVRAGARALGTTVTASAVSIRTDPAPASNVAVQGVAVG